MKKALLFSIVGLYLIFAIFTQGCNTDNPITSNPTYDSTILVFNNIIIDEYFDNNSYSGVNLLEGKVVTESDNLNKDIQLRDSSGTSANFYFRSGDLAILDDPGYQTKFTPVAYNFTQAQFDTLSSFPYFSNPINPVNDFTEDRTGYFNMPITTSQRVYGFYLKGRYPGFNNGKKVYGMMYIDSIYQTAGVPKFLVRADFKINKAELNQFNPYHN